MSADNLAQQLLADIAAKAEAGQATVRRKATDAKTRLEQGMLNLQAQTVERANTEFNEPTDEMAWDLEAADSPAETGDGAILASSFDDFSAAPEPPVSFKDELDVATDDDGIPLGE